VESLVAHCNSLISFKNSFFLAFFLGGLTGGFTHCLSMCGPFVACRTMCAGGSCNKTQASQLPYHLGRFTTYGLLGFFAALLSKQIAYSPYWPRISAVMLAVAGVMFLVSSLPKCHHLFKPNGKLTYVSGLLLGFMPCGLLYAALMMAATTANPLKGMVGMWLFVLGTIPALLVARHC
jgi:sulfite exporter TauE/SafE